MALNTRMLGRSACVHGEGRAHLFLPQLSEQASHLSKELLSVMLHLVSGTALSRYPDHGIVE